MMENAKRRLFCNPVISCVISCSVSFKLTCLIYRLSEVGKQNLRGFVSFALIVSIDCVRVSCELIHGEHYLNGAIFILNCKGHFVLRLERNKGNLTWYSSWYPSRVDIRCVYSFP